MDFRKRFDEVAELYDAIRPRYPAALFAALVRQAGLRQDARLLEIAPGTGQATLPLARQGFGITAVELGARMADLARDRLRAYPAVNVLQGAFEDVELPAGAFDLVYCATAFHWIAPEIRFAKSHALLKPLGHIAIIHRHHVSDERGDAFTAATQPIYRRHEPHAAGGARAYVPRRWAELEPAPIEGALFVPVSFAVFPEAVCYSGRQYAQLLSTYSPTLAMSPELRRSFLNDIEHLIAVQFGGQIVQHYAVSLQIARKT